MEYVESVIEARNMCMGRQINKEPDTFTPYLVGTKKIVMDLGTQKGI